MPNIWLLGLDLLLETRESGGKKLSSSTRKGNRVLRTILVQSAHALARTKTYLAAQYRRISGRRGKKRAESCCCTLYFDDREARPMPQPSSAWLPQISDLRRGFSGRKPSGHIRTIAYHLISRQEVYQDLGADYFDKQRPESVKKRLIKRLEKLGYQVTLEPTPVAL